MTDTPTGGEAPEPAPTDAPTDAEGEGPTKGQQSKLVLRSQFLKDLSFENLQPPESMDLGLHPRGGVSIDLTYDPISSGLFELALKIKVQASIEDRPAYLVDLDYRGRFEVGATAVMDIDRLLTVRGAGMLFPFARAIIYSATREGGFPGLGINPVDFHALFRQRQASLGRGGRGRGGGGGGQRLNLGRRGGRGPAAPGDPSAAN